MPETNMCQITKINMSEIQEKYGHKSRLEKKISFTGKLDISQLAETFEMDVITDIIVLDKNYNLKLKINNGPLLSQVKKYSCACACKCACACTCTCIGISVKGECFCQYIIHSANLPAYGYTPHLILKDKLADNQAEILIKYYKLNTLPFSRSNHKVVFDDEYFISSVYLLGNIIYANEYFRYFNEKESPLNNEYNTLKVIENPSVEIETLSFGKVHTINHVFNNAISMMHTFYTILNEKIKVKVKVDRDIIGVKATLSVALESKPTFIIGNLSYYALNNEFDIITAINSDGTCYLSCKEHMINSNIMTPFPAVQTQCHTKYLVCGGKNTKALITGILLFSAFRSVLASKELPLEEYFGKKMIN